MWLEGDQLSAIEAIEAPLAEEITVRESRWTKAAPAELPPESAFSLSVKAWHPAGPQLWLRRP